MIGKLRILLIDDRKEVVNLISETVTSLGMAFESENAADKGISRANAREYALIIIRSNLPGSSGVEIAKSITTSSPILFLTSSQPEDHKFESKYNLKIIDYICEPFRSEVLRKKIEYHCPTLVESDSLSSKTESQVTRLESVPPFTDITDHEKHEDETIPSNSLPSLEKFCSGLAHEFNNIIHGISNSVAAIERSCTDDRMTTYLNILKRQSKKAQKVAEGLRYFSSKVEVNKSSQDIIETINQAVALSKSFIKSDASITVNFQPDLDYAYIDPFLMSEVFGQIILNANEALGDRGVISIDVRNAVREDKKYVSIEISDDGIGIPENIKDKVFDPFFSTRRSDGKVGLGLSVASHIVQKHNGFLSLMPCNVGTKINIDLPVDENIVSSNSFTPSTRNVAIVSNDQRTITFIRNKLFEKNIKVETFDTLKSLFSKITVNRQTYQGYLLDADSFGPYKENFYENLQSLEAIDNVTLLIYQNQLDDVFLNKMVEKGCIVMAKPCDKDDLVDILLGQFELRSAS